MRTPEAIAKEGTRSVNELRSMARDLEDKVASDELLIIASDVEDAIENLLDAVAQRDLDYSVVLDDIHELEQIIADQMHVVTFVADNFGAVNDWCMEHFTHDYYRIAGNRMVLVNKDEAMLFKLRWGGKA